VAPNYSYLAKPRPLCAFFALSQNSPPSSHHGARIFELDHDQISSIYRPYHSSISNMTRDREEKEHFSRGHSSGKASPRSGTRDKEENERFSRGHSSGSGKSSGNGGSGGKDKMAIRHRHSDGSGNDTSPRHHSDDRHRSRRITRKGLRIFVGTANLSQAIPGMLTNSCLVTC